MVAHRQVCNLSEPQFPHLQNKKPQHLPHGVVGMTQSNTGNELKKHGRCLGLSTPEVLSPRLHR